MDGSSSTISMFRFTKYPLFIKYRHIIFYSTMKLKKCEKNVRKLTIILQKLFATIGCVIQLKRDLTTGKQKQPPEMRFIHEQTRYSAKTRFNHGKTEITTGNAIYSRTDIKSRSYWPWQETD